MKELDQNSINRIQHLYWDLVKSQLSLMDEQTFRTSIVKFAQLWAQEYRNRGLSYTSLKTINIYLKCIQQLTVFIVKQATSSKDHESHLSERSKKNVKKEKKERLK